MSRPPRLVDAAAAGARRWQLLVLLLACLLTSAAAAQAEPPMVPQPVGGAAVDPLKDISISATPLLGDNSLAPGAWSEVIVRIRNGGSSPLSGNVEVYGGYAPWSDERHGRTTSPFSASAGSNVSLRIPLRTSYNHEAMVQVFAGGKKVFSQSLNVARDNATLLFNVAKASALSAPLDGIAVSSNNDPWKSNNGWRDDGIPIARVNLANYDPVTGGPLLPHRAAGYARAAVVVMRSDELTRLEAAELEALSGYVLGGGSLALVIARPEDLRHEVLVALLGGEASAIPAAAKTTAPLRLFPSPLAGGSSHTAPKKPQPVAADPSPAVQEQLRSYAGGNLSPSLYGSSASYGLGEVHLLAFDPQTRPGVDDSWVHVRMLDLMRRANERSGASLIRLGDSVTETAAIRRQLDPNENSRWGILLAALLLVIYSVIAGPVNYNYWRSRHKPLRAILYLPIFSAVTFIAVVGIGFAAKGCSGRSRHVTFVDAAAGMGTAPARRWRGFFTPGSDEITVTAGSASSVLASAMDSYGDDADDTLVVDRKGMRWSDMPLRPWETRVVVEDGYADLGKGVSIVKDGSDLIVINRTDRRLLGLVLVDGPRVLFLEQLAAGASAKSSDFRASSGGARSSLTRSGSAAPYASFDTTTIGHRLNGSAAGLDEAWQAVTRSTHDERDWFPADVPVLLAQLEGGEGITHDSGLRIDSDRVLLRIVGYGGTR